MNIDQAALDRWGAACERACAECELAELLLIESGAWQALTHVARARAKSQCLGA